MSPVTTQQLPADTGEALLLQQIRRYPMLTSEEERELAKACARGDQQAITTMVNANLRLVVSQAKAYAGRGMPLLDLRNASDWLMMYAVTADEESMSERLEQVIDQIFSDSANVDF